MLLTGHSRRCLMRREEVDEASQHCVQAKLSATKAAGLEKEAEMALKKLGAGAVTLSKALRDAREANGEAKAAVTECETAEEAARQAEIATLDAAYEVLNQVKADKKEKDSKTKGLLDQGGKAYCNCRKEGKGGGGGV
ncbi:hypothetical protein TcBrA4_0101170 [Trypanosoma cruzi]|nr:hypothetical protein TcBrA4_0101170 [Trypanosoma cruzi]